MQRAASSEEFLRAPNGSYMAGRTWLHFCIEPLSGVVVWGMPTLADVRSVAGILPIVGSLVTTPKRLFDVRKLVAPEPAAFAAFFEYVEIIRPTMRAIEKLAVIRSHEMIGALAIGISSLASLPFPVELFDDPRHALAWLQIDAADQLLDELDTLQADATGMTPLQRDLRELVGRKLRSIAVRGAAAELGFSVRTLQRRLRELGTSFQQELDAVRIELAQHQLIRTDAPIKEIAFATGCASISHFSELFLRATGVTPSEWRKRGSVT